MAVPVRTFPATARPGARRDPAMAAMRRISDAARAGRTRPELEAILVEALRSALEVDQVHLSELSQNHEFGRGTIGAGGDDAGEDQHYVLVLDERPSGVGRVMATGQTLHVPDARASSELRVELVERWDVASALYVPLGWGGEIREVAILISHTPRTFTPEEIELAEALSDQAALGLALLESERRRAGHEEHDSALARAARALNASLELDEVLETLSREADLAVGGAQAGVYLADGSGAGVATAGHNLPADWKGYRIPAGVGVAGRVLESGRPWITNAYQSEIGVPAHSALTALHAAAGVPMRWNGELKGALSVGFAEDRRITNEDVRTLEAIADLAVVACRNAEAYEEARSAATTDALTGLLNHGALHERAREEVSRARRDGTALSCLLIDLDEFKAVNDDHGHQAGDALLARVAETLRVELREYDGLARYGGDEFVILLPGAGEQAARAVAERVRAAVLQVAPCSAGLAEWSEPLAADELLERADRALLLAKRSGKGRVAVAGAELEHELELLQAPDGSPGAVMREFWEMVAGCDSGRDALLTLPAFLRRAIGAEEVALFELDEGSSALDRTALARQPGDPQPTTFCRSRLQAGPGLQYRLGLGALSRPSLDGLLAALGVETEAADREAPVGAYAAVPLAGPAHAHGVIALRGRRAFSPERLRLAEMLARQVMAVVVARPDAGSPAAVQALAAAIEARDNYTHEHSEQVVQLATEVARELGLGPSELERVRHGALLHDVGKLAIPNEILHKPGPLDEAEWKVMAEHPAIGERILRRTRQLAHLAPIVRHEHERWDGTGYPDGLAGPAIPIASRIILACDAYNAMITTRPYRVAMPESSALSELRNMAGSQFDPDVVHALLSALEAQRP